MENKPLNIIFCSELNFLRAFLTGKPTGFSQPKGKGMLGNRYASHCGKEVPDEDIKSGQPAISAVCPDFCVAVESRTPIKHPKFKDSMTNRRKMFCVK